MGPVQACAVAAGLTTFVEPAAGFLAYSSPRDQLRPCSGTRDWRLVQDEHLLTIPYISRVLDRAGVEQAGVDQDGCDVALGRERECDAAPLCQLPGPITDPERIAHLDVRRRDRLGGALHEYRHAALPARMNNRRPQG